jgi:hypothetical protein
MVVRRTLTDIIRDGLIFVAALGAAVWLHSVLKKIGALLSSDAAIVDIFIWTLLALCVIIAIFALLFLVEALFIAPFILWSREKTRIHELESRPQERNRKDRKEMAKMLLVDRRKLADKVSEIAIETLEHPGGDQSFSIFKKARSLRDRFSGEDIFDKLWQDFEDSIVGYLLVAPAVVKDKTDVKGMRASLWHEQNYRPAIDLASKTLTNYLLLKD